MLPGLDEAASAGGAVTINAMADMKEVKSASARLFSSRKHSTNVC